jgi:hypothetical protein
MDRWFVLAVAAVSLGASLGCSSGNHPPPCGSTDAAVVEVGIEPPPGCPPAEANELGIGKACGMCGDECGSSLHCTCTPYLGVQLTGVPCVCTKVQIAKTGSTDPCQDSTPTNFCGSNATCCNYVTSAAYCVPDVCLPGGQCVVFVPVDAGTD